MKRLFLFFLALAAFLPFAARSQEIARKKIIIRKVSGFDPAAGFDHPAWKTAPAENMICFMTQPEYLRRLPREGGKIRLLCDEKYLYVRGDLEDSDIRNTGENDTHLYAAGDVLEIFLKPLDHPGYWEIHGSPNGKRTVFHYPSRGCLGLPWYSGPQKTGIKIYVKVDGTLNDSADSDRSWSLIAAIPWKELEGGDGAVGPGSRWTIAVNRYNYGKNASEAELSTCPQLADHFHASEYYALLELTE